MSGLCLKLIYYGAGMVVHLLLLKCSLPNRIPPEQLKVVLICGKIVNKVSQLRVFGISEERAFENSFFFFPPDGAVSQSIEAFFFLSLSSAIYCRLMRFLIKEESKEAICYNIFHL